MSRMPRRCVPRAPFVITATLAVTAVSAAAACGGRAFAGGSGAEAGIGGVGGGTGGAGGSVGGAGGGVGGVGGSVGGSVGGGGAPGCPTMLPGYGTACASEGLYCEYPTGPCCPPSSATCSAGRWLMTGGTCNPPPPLPCPADVPLPGSSCFSDPCGGGSAYCSWGMCTDGSPAVSGYCQSGSWVLNYQCASADGGPPDCSSAQKRIVEFAASNKYCALSSDCVPFYGRCSEGADYCDGTFYVNKATDPSYWIALQEELQFCQQQTGQYCDVCAGIAPPPECINGMCQVSFN